ncbi:hypothetical protein ACROYT_G032386 [Oculina patagonica]
MVDVLSIAVFLNSRRSDVLQVHIQVKDVQHYCWYKDVEQTERRASSSHSSLDVQHYCWYKDFKLPFL